MRHEFRRAAAGAAAGALLALSACPAAAASPGQVEPHIDGRRISDDIKVLSSDAFEGRAPGTKGEVKTLAFLISAFKTIGLRPGGEHGGWTQAVPLRRFTLAGAPEMKFSLAGRVRPVTQLDEIVLHSKTPDGHVRISGAPVVFVGYGVDAPERAWNDFKDYDVRGKILVVLVNDPDGEMAASDPLYGRFDGRAMTYYGRWSYKYEEAARRGALGVLIVHEAKPAGYGWNVLQTSDGVPQYDIQRPDPHAVHPTVEAWIQRSMAEELFRSAGLDFAAEKARAQSADFSPVELRGVTFSADYTVKTTTIVSHNVVGRLAGATHPDETVIYGAHWDHLGIGQPDARGDRIYNGAVDNASGVAGMLEIARQFVRSPRPERSVLFIGFTGEEMGLLGSDYYASHPLVPLAKTVALLNLDTVNLKGPARDVTSGGDGGSNLDALLAVAAKQQGRVFKPDPNRESGGFYRGDNFSLAKVGVPSVTIASGKDLEKGGLEAGLAWAKDYVANRYHQPSDEWQDWDMGGAVIDLTIYFHLGQTLANSREWPFWNDTSEFKAVRDRTAAARASAP